MLFSGKQFTCSNISLLYINSRLSLTFLFCICFLINNKQKWDSSLSRRASGRITFSCSNFSARECSLFNNSPTCNWFSNSLWCSNHTNMKHIFYCSQSHFWVLRPPCMKPCCQLWNDQSILIGDETQWVLCTAHMHIEQMIRQF